MIKQLHYEIIPGNKKNILFLHGWGASFLYYKQIAKKLEYTSILLDLPGFGKSPIPKKIMTSFDYANVISQFVEFLNLKDVVVVGHSFGGKIAAILASKNPEWMDKLVIISAPGIKRRNLKLKTKVAIYKILFRIFRTFGFNVNRLREKFGSEDYKNSKGIMREILKGVVSEDISEEIKKINKNTLIIWGEFDDAVPIYVAKEYKRLIKNSKLIIYENAGHFPFLENIDRFLKDLKNFVGG
ncbi:alpha/beta hydrolase [Thermosipho melanesiensis]|uniref:Alpha/beta hydrolase fold n=2 Tax=Thermosipho melanesiensis TaxID=46541 RepID=A6LKA3_THEM4|nr:alpha/beta hydrolase [Thermosipho melanesiensis]ABR30354.1 alpha/beta hydrolase fold [Thermosipho melanesiensis BI429]APT73520.1 alpha/beta hydrolase [Thermosipho melanesiensis]OOC37470.1 alpha/beta hydrolase [Thermosipho melanesiensis]OOC39675.1 alpha/beta hydrolase [Thermosipho melanesiensis]OOC39703.1 alpha/beta hydrolase [Thermosipho melanesiensis]